MHTQRNYPKNLGVLAKPNKEIALCDSFDLIFNESHKNVVNRLVGTNEAGSDLANWM